MPLMRITPLGRQRLYLTRHMWADDEHAEIEPSCVEAAKKMGYAEDPAPEPAPRRRGRPPKAAPGETPIEERTVPELRQMAEEQGAKLPAGYVKHEDLVKIVRDSDESPADDD